MPSDVTSPKHFQITLFGGPLLQVAGRPCGLSGFQGGLLGFLYGGPLEHTTREEAIALLWPDETPSVARRRLNQLLYALKKKTGTPPPFITEGEEIHRVGNSVDSDLSAFMDHLGSGRLLDCAELLSLGFLKRGEGRITREYSEWIDARQTQLGTLLKKRGQALLSTGEETGQWLLAREAAEALLSLDPLDEGILRALMKALSNLHGVREAESAMAQFAEAWRLRRGTPWDPAADTRSLIERIRSREPEGEIQLRFGSGVERQLPALIGRDREHQTLRRTLLNPPRGPLRGVLISGEAGIGKTRLINEALSGIDLQGQSAFGATLSELEQFIPLNPFIDAFRGDRVGDVLRDLDEPWRTVLFGVMPHHYKGDGPIPHAPEIQPGSVPRRLFEAVDQLLMHLVGAEPTILVIEDVQWADDTTLLVLEFLFRRWERGKLQIVLSVRSEEVRRKSTLRRFLEFLKLHKEFQEIQLLDLDNLPSQKLIQSLSDRELRPEEVSYLQSLAGGNPFFLIELTLEYLAGRVDRPVLPATDISIPLSIKQVLRRRLSQLAPESERILNAVSVHTRPISVTDLNKVTGIPVEHSIGGLEQLHQFRLIRNEGTQIAPAHELIRQTVYQELNPSVRAWIHERVGRLLQEAEIAPPPDELAIHFHKANVAEEALLFAKEAADRAEESGAIPEALQFLKIAREHTSDPGDAASILGRMGHLNYLDQNLEEAAPLLEIAARRQREQGEISKALRWELERVDALGKIGLLPLRECLEELDALETEALENEEWAALMRTLDVKVHFFDKTGALQEIRHVFSKAHRYSSRGSPDAKAKANALLALNIYFGSPTDGLKAARKAVKIAETTSDNDLILHGLNRLLLTLLHQGLLNTNEGRAVRARAKARSQKTGDLILKYYVRLNTGVWHLETNDLDQAESHFLRAKKVIIGSRTKEPLIRLHLNLGELHLARFETQAARESYEEALRHIDRASNPNYRTLISVGLGLCALYEGNLTEARQRESEIPGIPSFWTYDPTQFVLFKARMHLRRGDQESALRLLGAVRAEVGGRFVPAWIRLALEELRIKKRMGDPDLLSLAMKTHSLALSLGLHKVAEDIQTTVPAVSEGQSTS